MALFLFICANVDICSFQIVSGGPMYNAEYVVVEANCTEDDCTPLNDTMAVSAKRLSFPLPKRSVSFSKLSKTSGDNVYTFALIDKTGQN